MNFLKMTDAQLAEVLDCKPARVKKLRKEGAPVKDDGTWHIFKLFGFLCKKVKRRRKE